MFSTKTSPKGFLASKCNIGNCILLKSWEFFGNSLGILWDFFGNSLGSYLNIEGINLFVKFWFLSRFCLNAQGRRTKFRSLKVREASSSHLKIMGSFAIFFTLFQLLGTSNTQLLN